MHIGVREPRIRALLRRLLQAGLSAADPALAVRRKVTLASGGLCIGRRRYDFHEDSRVLVVGAGKASARMAHALEDLLGSRLDGGLVVVKYAHRVPTRRVELAEAGHPLPDRAGKNAAGRLLSLVEGLLPNDLLVVLLSGGASSLLPAPAPGVTLADKQRTSALLLRSGANIHEINTVRKHISTIKGGRLAAATRARVVSLILSDVIGDDLATIGSGPTAPDPTTYADACMILRRFHIWTAVPRAVRQHLTKGRQGRVGETPKPGSSVFKRVENVIIGSNCASVQAVAREAQHAGLRPFILSASMTGEAKDAAREFGAIAKQIVSVGKPVQRPACVIGGGELTVTVRGRGRGGRAQEFALAAAREISGLKDVWTVGFGTDGTDGPTDAAGAVVDGRTLARAERLELAPDRVLRRNDTYRFFKRVGGHIISGPTGTNVNDLYLLIAL